MFSSDPSPTDPLATTPGTSAVVAEERPGGAAPVGTPPTFVVLSGSELPAVSADMAATLGVVGGARVLVVMVRDRRAPATN